MTTETMDSENTNNAAVNEKHSEDGMADAQAALSERTRQAAKADGKYVHDNRWDWR